MNASPDLLRGKRSHFATEAVQQHLEVAVQIARGGVWAWEVETGELSMSDGYLRLLGIEDPATVGSLREFWPSRVHPDDLERVRRLAHEHAVGRTEVFEIEYRLQHMDGRWLHVLDRARALQRDARGKAHVVVGFLMDITERWETEAALRASEERLRLATDAVNGFVYEVDLDTSHAIYYGVEKFTGYTEEEIRALGGWYQLVPESDRERVWPEVVRHRGDLSDYQVEYRVIRRDGSEMHVWHRGSYFDVGTGPRAYGFIEDVTARVQAEKALRTSEFRFRAVSELTPGYVFEARRAADSGVVMVYASASFEGVMGCTRAEFDARGGWATFCSAESLADYERHIDWLRAGLRMQVDLHGTNFRGEERWLRMRSMPIYDSTTGRRTGTIGAVNDITAAKRAELALLEQQDDLRLHGHIIQTLQEGVAMKDERGRILVTNPAFDRMFGYSHAELIGRTDEILAALPPATYARNRERIHAAAAVAPLTLELEGLRKDGSRFVASCTFVQIMIGGEARYVSVLTDVTERKRLEREILQIVNREQQRIGSDLHDGLGQELTGVALMLKSLAARLARASDATVRADVEHIIGLVNGAIDSTRGLARGLSPVSADRDGLVMGLEALVSQNNGRYGVRVTFHNDLPEGHKFDDATATHLYRIAQEALANAVRHGKADRVSMELSAEGGQVELVIQDNGKGFDGSKTREAGMGLKIMRYRAQMLGGDLTVESTPGSGTIVRAQYTQAGGEA